MTSALRDTHTHTLSLSLLLCLFQKLCEVVAVVAIGGLPEPLSHRVIHDIHSAFRDTHTHSLLLSRKLWEVVAVVAVKSLG